ncbi:aminodeoxychorismate/anthranilate synthase component II [Myxococcota bacterium]|nr:aminodeoxychorismate/anthranilate synthase component II [Myxococcota bacterium]
MPLLVIDNYDSFTYNLVQYLAEMGAEVEVARNDAIDLEGIRRYGPSGLVISPGPGGPGESGVSLEAIRELSGSLPILGVCLGHQAIAEVFGARVARARRVMHGKGSAVDHDGTGLFHGVSRPMEVGRYHSLAVVEASLPPCLRVTARTRDDGEVMALAHTRHPTVGVQFHPESILSPEGKTLLRNFLEGRFR